MGFPKNACVDHRNGNKLDNRDENLRLATKSQNGVNWQTPRPKSISQYYGVSRNRRTGHWTAEISDNGTRHFLGVFETQEDAVRVRDGAAIALHGDFAKLAAPHLQPIPYTPKPKRTKTSQYKGVCKCSNAKNSWQSRVMIKGVIHNLGIFQNEEEAANARNEFLAKHHP